MTPRVLHLIDTGGPGGAETVYAQLVGAAQAAGHCAAALVPYDGWLAARLRGADVTPLIVPTAGALSLRLLARLCALARRQRANVLHAHLLGASVYAALAGRLLGLPVIAVLHGATDLGGKRGRLDAVKRWLLAGPRVRLVAVSDVVRDALVSWGVPATRIRVLRNGVDVTTFVPGSEHGLHDELGLPHSTRLIGAVGNIRAPKAYDVMLAAAAVVCAARADVHFVAAGDGTAEQFAPLLALRERLGLAERFHFLGFRAADAALYRSFAVFVSSASTEGLPLSFLEAMACGLPIAATASDGARSLLQATQAGLLAPVGDAGELAQAIVQLLDDAPLANALAARGRAAVEQDYSLQATIRAYAALTAELAAA